MRWTLVEQPFEDQLLDRRGRAVEPPTHAEEHHGGAPDDAPPTQGYVRSISSVTFEHAEVPGAYRTYAQVPGSGRTQERYRVDGWESELPPGEPRSFAGYVVDLDVPDAEPPLP